jgi:hypothetical protein
MQYCLPPESIFSGIVWAPHLWQIPSMIPTCLVKLGTGQLPTVSFKKITRQDITLERAICSFKERY